MCTFNGKEIWNNRDRINYDIYVLFHAMIFLLHTKKNHFICYCKQISWRKKISYFFIFIMKYWIIISKKRLTLLARSLFMIGLPRDRVTEPRSSINSLHHYARYMTFYEGPCCRNRVSRLLGLTVYVILEICSKTFYVCFQHC